MPLSRQQQTAVLMALLAVTTIWMVNGIYLSVLAHISVTLFWMADLVQWIIIPSLLLGTLLKKYLIVPAQYGFDTREMRWRSLLLTAPAVFTTSWLAYNLTEKAAWNLFGQPGGYFSFPGVFPDGLMGLIITFYAAITAGVIESIFFIGLPWLLYQSSSTAPSRVVFTLATSTIFALAHWEQGPHIIFAAFVFEVVACAWFFRLGSLWPIALGHMLVDLTDFL